MTSRATDRVISAVANHFYLSPGQLLSKDRHKSIALARQVAMYVLREHQHPCPSFPELGREFGNRHHTTVMTAIKHVVKVAAADEHVRNAIEVGRLALEDVTVNDEITRLQALRRRDGLLRELRKVQSELASLPVIDLDAAVGVAAE